MLAPQRKEVGFPYMLSSRLPPDTLFLYFESDFRFHKADSLTPEEWLPYLFSEPVARDDDAACAVEADPEEPVARRGSFGQAQPWRRPQAKASECAPELADVVRICTLAHRAKDEQGRGRGEVVWLSWNAGQPGHCPKKKTDWKKIQYGSQAVAFTKRGAAHLLAEMQKGSSEHFDLWLKKVLRTYPEASYCCPPIGGYTAHKSPNLKGRVRASSFDEAWARPGSGRELDPTSGDPRVLRSFGSGLDVVATLVLPEGRQALWRTEPPPTLASPDNTMRWLLQELLQWQRDDGFWWGPCTGQTHWGPQLYRTLAERPDEYPQEEPVALAEYQHVQLTNLQRFLVCLHESEATGDAESQEETRRMSRHRRNVVAHYRHRFQAAPGEEACAVQSEARASDHG